MKYVILSRLFEETERETLEQTLVAKKYKTLNFLLTNMDKSVSCKCFFASALQLKSYFPTQIIQVSSQMQKILHLEVASPF
jgi:hypothetical protein